MPGRWGLLYGAGVVALGVSMEAGNWLLAAGFGGLHIGFGL